MKNDGVAKIRESLRKRGVLPFTYWMVEEIESNRYIAIDCNHRLAAFREEGIEEAECLVFPKLPQNEYDEIAGLANEAHDNDCVHVTDWDKFYIVYRKIRTGEYDTNRGTLDTAKLENDIVS